MGSPPYRLVLHVTSNYAPTFMAHGKEDMDIDYRESVKMAEALAAAGVDHDLILLDHTEHGVDRRLRCSTITRADMRNDVPTTELAVRTCSL